MCQHDHPCAEVERLKSKIADLEHQLDAQARTVVEQSVKLSAEQVQLRLQKTLLECQSEASILPLHSTTPGGTVMDGAAIRIRRWGLKYIPQSVVTLQRRQAPDPEVM
jgi:hypothetical protein